MHRNFFLIVVFLSLFSCMGTVDRLEWALTLAGENRTELEKVLQYYKDDSLKYKAACFLIENMPYHYGYEDARLDSVKAVLATAPLGDGYIRIVRGKESGSLLIINHCPYYRMCSE